MIDPEVKLTIQVEIVGKSVGFSITPLNLADLERDMSELSVRLLAPAFSAALNCAKNKVKPPVESETIGG